jgi:hypothetical protein
METATMGKVFVTAKIVNLQDLYNAQQGSITEDKVRSIEVTDAMVDVGATNLMVPRGLIAQLGLRPFRTRQARTAAGWMTVQIYEAVRMTVQAASTPATWPRSRTSAGC